MRRALPSSVLAVVASLAIGVSSASAAPTTVPPEGVRAPVVCNTVGPPCSAITPDKAAPAAPPTFPGLFGSSIRLDTAGTGFIAGFENVVRSVYCPEPDPVLGWAVPTRAFGETEGITSSSGCISYPVAIAKLHALVEARYMWAIRGLGVSFTQHQVDALASFVWNLGAGIFTGGLREAIQHHNPFPMLAYDHAGGQVIAGLAARRRAEVALFLRPEAPPETPAQHRARVHRERVGRLHADYRARRGLDGVLARFNCLRGYRRFSRDHARKCTVWRAKHAAVNRDIKRLHRLGIW